MSLKNGYINSKSVNASLSEGIMQPIAISFTILQIIIELSILLGKLYKINKVKLVLAILSLLENLPIQIWFGCQALPRIPTINEHCSHKYYFLSC